MKKMKKLVSLVLAMVMVMAMTMNVSAAEVTETGTITIDNAVEGQKYSVYQILDLESYSVAAEAYAYKATDAWKTFINSAEIKGVYVNVDDQEYVTWVEGADAAAFAKLAQAYAKTNELAAQAEKIADGTTVEFTGLDLGYYLVDTTLGTICSLDTTNPTVTIKEKNEEPTIEKEVQEDSNSTWGETNDADINQVVNYKATIAVKEGAENYIMHDTMSKGLTFTGAENVKVTVDGETVSNDNYEVVVPGTCGCTFEVVFDNTYIATVVGKEIVVEYSATLNENAVVGLPGNPNDVKLQYGDENKPSYTPVDTTITYTWDTKVVKFTTKDGEEVLLAGATFKLSTDEEGSNVLKFHNLGDNKYEVCADAACTKEHVTEITTDETGTFYIEGLDSGTYYLTETKAPAGYNMLAGPVTITITGATTPEGSTELTYTTVETKVENKTGAELPSTGGMGTTIFYLAGGALVVLAAVLLITRKRMSAE